MKYLLYIIGMLLLFSCDKSSDIIPEVKQSDPLIKIQVYYTTPNDWNKKIADPGAKIYVYYDKSSVDFLGHAYPGNGKFTKKDNIILPNQVAVTDEYGKAIITPLYKDRSVLFYIESNYYSNRLASDSYSSCEKDITTTCIFNK